MTPPIARIMWLAHLPWRAWTQYASLMRALEHFQKRLPQKTPTRTHRYCLLLVHMVAGIFCALSPFPAKALTLLTEDLPPFNYLHDNAVRGPGVDIVTEVLRSNGLTVPPDAIRVLPWPRAFHLAQNTPDSLLFCTARTPDREQLFRWVGPVMHVSVGVVVRKGNRVVPRQWGDLQGMRVGTVRNTMGEQLLLDKGLSPSLLHAASSPVDAVRMLDAGRVDALVFNIHSMRYIMEQANIDSTQYVVSMNIQKFDLYMAFNPAVDATLLHDLQATLDAMRCNGGVPGTSVLARIVQQYTPYFRHDSFPEERNCPRPEGAAP